MLKTLIESAMQAEGEEHLGAGRYERNASKPRTLRTRGGELHFEVSRVRECEPYNPSMFRRRQRSERALLVACAEMYFQGVSRRKVQALLEKMCGFGVSAMTVSRIAAEVDAKLDAVRGRRLTVEYPYLMADARYEKVRAGGTLHTEAVLVAAGFDEQGGREILDWRNGDSESRETGGSVFRDLKQRGLKGVKLVISDAHSGIRAALDKQLQGVARQRCRVHFKREIGRKVASKEYREVLCDLAAVCGGEDRKECPRRAEEMARKWEAKKPKVAAIGVDEHERTNEEDDQAAHASGGGISQPRVVRAAGGGAAGRIARAMAARRAPLLQHGKYRGGNRDGTRRRAGVCERGVRRHQHRPFSLKYVSRAE